MNKIIKDLKAELHKLQALHNKLHSILGELDRLPIMQTSQNIFEIKRPGHTMYLNGEKNKNARVA